MMSAQLRQAVTTAPAQAVERDPACTGTSTATATPHDPLAHNAPGQDASGPRSAAASVPVRPLLNRAGDSSSPYVRAHRDTPVAWQLFDDEAIARARRENKLIFLHIGFKACHYCRLTYLDSFSHPSVASLLNSAFVPAIVDREERPDIDRIYMNYIQAVNSTGGWPLNLFLTPELEPVFGGLYWPGPTRGDSVVGSYAESLDGEDEERLDFLAILKKLQKVWAEQETKCRTEARDIVLKLREFAAEGTLGTRRGITLTLPTSTGLKISGIQDDIGAEPAPPPTLVEPATATAATTDLDVDLDQLEEAYSHISRTFDRTNGGFNLAPKFPTPPKLTFLLRLARFPSAVADVLGGHSEVANATHMAVHTLRKLRDSGLRDHIGAGFFRYSATADWSMPHFEKMVADNALLLGVYLDAWLGAAAASPRTTLSLDDEFADVVLELANYLTSRPIRTPEGLFATSEASDSFYRKGDGHMCEGGYYLWTKREFDTAVREVGNTGVSGAGGGAGTSSGELAAQVAAAHFHVLEHGNVPRDHHDPHDEFINQNVLRVVKNEAELGSAFGISADGVRRILAGAHERLRSRRERDRVAPEVDDQVVLSVNALAVTSLARTGAVLIETGLDTNKGARYLSAAETAIKEIKGRMWDPEAGKLYRTSRAGVRGQTEALAEDYAFLIEALLYLYEATGREDVLNWADDLQKKQIELFYDHTATGEHDPATASPHPSSSGGFYATAESAPHLILRLKDGMDTSQPSTNAVSASNLFRLALILGSTRGSRRQSVSTGVANPTVQSLTGNDYERLARETVRAFEVEMLQYPWLFPGVLTSVVTARLGGELQSVVGVDEETARKVKRAFFSKPRAALRAIVHAKHTTASSTVPPGRATAGSGA